jgi:hypothetical protein
MKKNKTKDEEIEESQKEKGFSIANEEVKSYEKLPEEINEGNKK